VTGQLSIHRTLPVGITVDIVRGDVYFWGPLMASSIVGSILVVIVYALHLRNDDRSGQVTARRTRAVILRAVRTEGSVIPRAVRTEGSVIPRAVRTEGSVIPRAVRPEGSRK